MINEANSDLTHREVISTMFSHFDKKGNRVFREFILPERRRADILVLTEKGGIAIVECKQDYRPRDIQHSVLKYALMCNELYFCFNSRNAELHCEAIQNFMTSTRRWAYGVISVDRLETKLLIPAGWREIAPTIRRELAEAIQKRVERPSG